MATSKQVESEVQALVESIADEACTGLFEAYGVPLRRCDFEAAAAKELLWSSVVGFTGPGIRGACILAATEQPLHQSLPISGSLRDWIAELCNQLTGRIKNRLGAHGAEVYVTTPVVLRGEHLAPLPRRETPPHLFSSEGGTVLLWLDVETEPTFTLRSPPEPLVVSEGEALLF